jgi:hypothetical protein
MNLIVMGRTIDYLVKSKQLEKIDELMGSSDDWDFIQVEGSESYYRKK